MYFYKTSTLNIVTDDIPENESHSACVHIYFCSFLFNVSDKKFYFYRLNFMPFNVNKVPAIMRPASRLFVRICLSVERASHYRRKAALHFGFLEHMLPKVASKKFMLVSLDA